MGDQETSHRLIIDLAANTGPIKHGAAGFLYGLGKEDIPSVNMLAPLKPQVAAQKPEDGLQHPNGDALNVARTYQAAGGKEIEIYIQDVYANWPYESLGLEEYRSRVEPVVRQVMAAPNRALFSYVPFNEPDQIWYNKGDKKQAFFDDWETIYRTIKAIDAAARIVGPNFANYDSACYREFMVFAGQNDCLPDVISWHELNDNFFDGWYKRYEDFRSIESSLGLPAREICINEYCRIKGDLGIPGQLIQWMARFENSKVDACLAYWTDAGSLNNLVARDNYNQATGSWWLYRWYGGMTGHTVKVAPPDANAEGPQGLAALDTAKKQVRILFGGCPGNVELVLTGFDAMPDWDHTVHAAVWVTEHTGLTPAGDPALVLEQEIAVSGGKTSVLLPNLASTAAYQVILTPSQAAISPQPHHHLAEYADLSGNAAILYADVVSVACNSGGRVNFVVTAPQNGYYEIRLNYATGLSIESGVLLALNGSPLANVSLTATATREAWSVWSTCVFLTAGINQITFEARDTLHIHSLEIAPGSGWIAPYKAEAAADGALEFDGIHVPQSGLYRMVVHFANAEFRGGHSYNSQVVDKAVDIQVNEGRAQRVYFRNTFTWDNVQSRVVDVVLQAGRNRIRFSTGEADQALPQISGIEIAAAKSG